MDGWKAIDLDAWPRRQLFTHYTRVVPCSYAMTVELDVTEFVAALRSTRRRAYIAQIWALASAVNRHDEFRLALDASGAPGVWTEAHPSFTVFHPESETFASLWAPFDSDFGRFHDLAERTIAAHADSLDLFPQGPPPPNTFDVSSVPWTSFTGFTLDIAGASTHLAPIFTLGRYVARDDRVLLPLAVQIHHAAADGFHTARLVNDLRAMFAEPGWLVPRSHPARR